MRIAIALALLSLTACDTRLSVESQFELKAESRLPKWVQLPAGVSRADVTVNLTYHTVAAPRVQVLKGLWPFRTKLVDVTAKRVGGYVGPKKLDVAASDPRSEHSYEVLTAEGVIDIIEHRSYDRQFAMVDDPEVWRQLGPR